MRQRRGWCSVRAHLQLGPPPSGGHLEGEVSLALSRWPRKGEGRLEWTEPAASPPSIALGIAALRDRRSMGRKVGCRSSTPLRSSPSHLRLTLPPHTSPSHLRLTPPPHTSPSHLPVTLPSHVPRMSPPPTQLCGACFGLSSHYPYPIPIGANACLGVRMMMHV